MTKELKFNFKTEWLPIFFIIISIAASFYFYSHFPEEVVTHWNFRGEADGWSSKGFAAFFFPGLLAFMYLMFLFLPKIDPRGSKYKQFGKTYNIFKTIIIAFMAGIYFIVGLNGIGYDIEVGSYIPIGVGLLMIIMGNYMSKIKSNWFIGIRTPWTLSSESVWSKTHRFGGKIFMLGGLLIALMPWVPGSFQLPLFILIIIIMVIGSFGYSYFAYRKEEKSKK
ncbi:MAG: SdpI family protein [bacterium]